MTTPRPRTSLRLLLTVLLLTPALIGPALLAPTSPSRAAVTVLQPRLSWETNRIDNTLPDMFKVHNRIYMAGGFSIAGPWTSGPLLLLDPDTGALLDRMPLLDGTATRVVADGLGGWFVGGEFQTLADPTLRNLVHIRPDRTLDLAWRPNVPDAISDMARNGDTLYYSSYHFTNGETRVTTVGSVDIPSGLPNPWRPALTDNVVQRMALSGAIVLLADWSGTENRLLAVSGLTGQVLWQHGLGSEWLDTLVVSGSTLYVSGAFTHIGATARDCVAALDVASGQVLPLSLSFAAPCAAPGGPSIRRMAVSGNMLYLHGNFSAINQQPRESYAAVNRVTGALSLWKPTVTGNDRDNALWAFNNRIYIANWAGMIGAFDAVTGETVWEDQKRPNDGSDLGFPIDLNVSGGQLLVSGSFYRYGMSGIKSLAWFDATTGQQQTKSVSPSSAGYLHAAADSDSLYVVYQTAPIGLIDVRYVVEGINLDTDLSREIYTETDQPVTLMQPGNRRLFIAGGFTTSDKLARPGLAAIDTSLGRPHIGATLADWVPQIPSGSVTSLLLRGDTLYVAVRTASATEIVALSAATGAPTGWSATLPGDVNSLAASASTLYAGGTFQDQDGAWGVSALDLGGQTPPVKLLAGAAAGSLVLRDSTLYLVSAGAVKLLDVSSAAVSDWGGAVPDVTNIADGGDELLVRWCSSHPSPEPPWSQTICGVKTFPYAGASAVTGPAQGLSGATITLHGSVTPNDSPVSAFFQITTRLRDCSALRTVGATPSGAVQVAAASGSQPQEVHATLDGLAPNTTYFYRLVVSNPYGVGYGNVEHFTTPAQLGSTSAAAQTDAPAPAPTATTAPAAAPAAGRLFLPLMQRCAQSGF